MRLTGKMPVLRRRFIMERQSVSRWRSGLLFGALAVGLAALAGRVAYLQFAFGPSLQNKIQRQEREVVELPARPGAIFARTEGGTIVVAASRQVPICYADPVVVGEEDFESAAAKLAPALGLNGADVFSRMYQRSQRRYAVLARGLTQAQADKVRQLKIPGIKVHFEWERQYPYDELMAHVLGYRQFDGEPAAGVEVLADRWLRAKPGHMVLQCDAARRGTLSRVVEYVPPEDGKHIVLTVDVVIQGFLEQALAAAREKYNAVAAFGVVMDPQTGEVLAMASYPTYNPNEYNKAAPEQRRLRALTDPFEPGSTFKPYIAVGAVQLQKATLRSQFFCHNGLYVSARCGTIRDFPGEHFGYLPLNEIIWHSSNIGMAKLGESLGYSNLYQIAHAFGFGQYTGIDLPGENDGKLVKKPISIPYATPRLPFGQGPIMTTSLQLCNATCAIANGGELLRPRVIDRVLDSDGKVIYQSERQRIRRVLSPEVAREFLTDALAGVVEKGTGKKAALELWTTFGKTGTGQIGGPRGYEERAYTASFVGGGPVSDPRIVCAMTVYRPDYSKGHVGGSVTAPFVREVLGKSLAYLNVPPDRPRHDAPGRPTNNMASR